ncbi:MAG: hypothetical protein K2Q12_00330 [Rickettsiales bacterium]|nr:hypothetical protein [Rickettsiales bacterium]
MTSEAFKREKTGARVPSPCSGEKRPSRETLRDWCKHGKWRGLATSYDEALAQETLKAHRRKDPDTGLEATEMLEKMAVIALSKATQVFGLLNETQRASVDDAIRLMDASLCVMDMRMRYVKFQKEMETKANSEKEVLRRKEDQRHAQADLGRIMQQKLAQAKNAQKFELIGL